MSKKVHRMSLADRFWAGIRIPGGVMNNTKLHGLAETGTLTSIPAWLAAILVALLPLLMVVIQSCGDDGNPAGDGGSETLLISNPNIDLDGFSVYLPEEKMGDCRAGDSEYVFLVINEEAVVLNGPSISSDGTNIEDLFNLDGEGIVRTGDSGFQIVVNERLGYIVSIDDFELEVDLARVELTKTDDGIQSQLTFVATGSGVAHDVTITAEVDESSLQATSPTTIESRSGEKGIEVLVRRHSDREETTLSCGPIPPLPFADFSFLVDFDTQVRAGGELIEVEYLGSWRSTSVTVYARAGSELLPFPEDDPNNELVVDVEILDNESILVSSVLGSYPTQSQIVLDIDFGEIEPGVGAGYTARIYTQ
jgi:hypothetical protein